MKKIAMTLLAVVTMLTCVFGFTACSPDGVKPASKYDASKVAVYNMDLSGIAGYEDKSVQNGTWAETYDKLIGWVKKEADTVKRYQLMHVAEDILMDSGSIVPLYYYTDIYMLSSKIKGFFASPLGYKYFMYTTAEGVSSLPVCIASEPQTIDPAMNSSVDGATMILHTFAGLVKYNERKELVGDCAKELPTPTVNSETGELTYVFQLKEGLKWSNGDDFKASDFEWSWKRAASKKLGADYGYMFDIIKGAGGEDVDGLAPLAVTADDTANTLTVVLPVAVPYFFELCAFPAYMPVHKATVEAHPEDWATKPETYVSNGAYKLTAWEHDTVITMQKNEHYHAAASITMPEIKFYLSSDASSMLANFKTGQWLMIDDVPTAEIESLRKDYPDEFKVDGQLGTYYVIFNNNLSLLPESFEGTTEEKYLANAEIRKALGLLLDRNYICEAIGQAGQVPASSFVAMGLSDGSATDGKEFYEHAGHNAGYIGYFDVSKSAQTSNEAQAITTLKKYFKYDESSKKFTDIPSFTYLYNTGEAHKAIGEYLQSAWAKYGVNCTLVNQEWNTFLETRKKGDYGVARNGWLGDYNDPISFLDMWITASGNNDAQFGKYEA